MDEWRQADRGWLVAGIMIVHEADGRFAETIHLADFPLVNMYVSFEVLDHLMRISLRGAYYDLMDVLPEALPGHEVNPSRLR